jgi:hypothetical protein
MKRRTRQSEPYRFTRGKAIAYGTVATVIAMIGYFGWHAMIPSNGTYPVFAPRENHFIKAMHSSSGYHYFSISSGSVKGTRGSGGGILNPEYTLSKDTVQSIHFVNEDRETHSSHNLNIDAFNVHTRDLNYFESQTIDFVPDKAGHFEYYCSIHSEMKGVITVMGEDAL